METLTAGTGKSFREVYDSLFGSSKPAKAFRALMKLKERPEDPNPDADALVPLAAQSIADMAGSQEFKARWNASGLKGLSWKGVENPRVFAWLNGWLLRDLKKWMDLELGVVPTRLSKETNDFLKAWVNTDVHHLPQPGRETVLELRPFRPEATRLYYRGVRFTNLGEMLQFHEAFAAGSKKPFPFRSERYTSWTTSVRVAERFGRYRGSSSQNSAMMSWFGRMQDKKDYDGHGGYVIGARIHPNQCLVDFAAPGLPFGGGIHGNEYEVIVLPEVDLVAKVYGVYGDVVREIEEYKSSYQYKTVTDPKFFGWIHPLKVVQIQGDDDAGTVTFKVDPDTGWGTPRYPADATPRGIALGKYSVDSSVMGEFHQHMYRADWISSDTVRYRRMDLPQRVARRFLRG